MPSLACVAAEVNERTGSAFLIAFQHHAAQVGLFQPLVEHLNAKIKAVRYSVLQKAQTLIGSILLGVRIPATSTTAWCPTASRLSSGAWSVSRTNPRSTSS